MLKDVAVTAATRIFLVVAGLLSSMIVVRLLGAEGRGIFFYWITLAGFAVQLGNFGLPASNTYYLARDQSLLRPLASNALVCSVGVGLVSVLIFQVAFWSRDWSLEKRWMLIGSTGVLVTASMYYLLAVNLLVALKRYKAFNLFEILNRYIAVAAVAVAALWWRTPEATLVGAATAALIICAPLFLHLHSLSGGGRERPSMALFTKGIGFAGRAYIITLIGFVVLRFNAIYLERVAGLTTLGEWSIAAQIMDTIGILPTAVSIVLFPAILTSDEPYAQMTKNLKLVAFAMLGICFGAVVAGRLFISILFGAEHQSAYDMLLYGLPSSFAIGLLSVVSQFLAATGFPVALIAIWAGGLLVELALSLYLVPEFAGIGAMMALSIAHIIIFLFAWALAHQLRHTTPQAN